MKNPTNRNRQGRMERATQLKQRVARMLRWSDAEYAEFVYAQGVDYLHCYLKGDAYSVAVMERTRNFWNWWKNHWANRDQAFIEFCLNTTYDLDTLREIYRDMHDARTLAECIYPNGVVLHESYAQMVTEYVREETTRV